MSDDREPFEQARAAGLAKRHERRLAHAREVLTPTELMQQPTAPDQPVTSGGVDEEVPPVEVADDFVIPEEAVEAGTQVYERGLGPGVHRMEDVVAAILRAALPHLRAHQIEGAGGVAEAREALIREFIGLIDVDAYVPDMPSWLRAFGERLLGLPILTPEEVEAETKALAETATKLGYELGRKEAGESVVSQMSTTEAVGGYYAIRVGPLYHTRGDAHRALEKFARDITKGTS